MARRRWNLETIKQVVDGENPFIQVGYSKSTKRRKVGDRWSDGKGLTWEQKNGYVVRYNEQADSIRQLVKRICSDCKKDLDLVKTDKLDEKVFPKTGKCYDCLEKEEAILRLTGEYDAYEKKKLLSNRLAALKEFRVNVIESIEYLKTDDCILKMVMSNGDIVTWTGAQNERILKEVESDLVKAEEAIKEVELALNELNLCHNHNQT